MIQEILIQRGWIEPTRGPDGGTVQATRAERLPGMGNKRVYRFNAGFEIAETENSSVAQWHSGKNSESQLNQTDSLENLPLNCHYSENSAVAEQNQQLTPHCVQNNEHGQAGIVAPVANQQQQWHANLMKNQEKENLPLRHYATEQKLSPEERNANILLPFLLMRDPQRHGAAVDLQEIESEIGLQGNHFSQARAVLEERGEIQITMYPRKSPVKLALKQEAA